MNERVIEEQVFRTCTSVKSSRFNVDETACLFEL